MSDLDNPGSVGNRQLDHNDLIAAATKLWGKPTRRTKTEWRFGTHGSKSIKLDDLVWHDHETGEGGGIVELCRRAGIDGTYGNGTCGPNGRDTRSKDDWQPNLDPPAAAPLNLLTCDKLFTYRCAAGNPTHYVKRFENPRKFLPLTFGTLNGATGWHLKAPKPPLPLYKLEDLHELDPELVLLTEGEKAADAANRKIAEEQLPWLAMSWYGGAGRAQHADVTPLAGRKVVIWPDADAPGLRARDQLAEMLKGASALDVTGLAQGFDAADLRREEKIEEWVKARMKAPEPVAPAPRPPAPRPPAPRPPAPGPPAPGPPAPGPPAPRPPETPEHAILPADIREWDFIAPPTPQWAVPNLIPLREVTLLSGEGAAGKSTIALHLAASTALGLGWIAGVPDKGPAFFIDAEDDINIIHWRLEAVRKFYGTTFTELHNNGLRIWSLAGKDALFTAVDKNRGMTTPTPLYKFFLNQARIMQPKIIVIASCANVFSGNENDRPQVTFFVNMLKALAIATEGSVVLISHPSHQGISTGTGLSGSTQWHNAVRARMVLKASEDDKTLRQLEFQKNQYGPTLEKVVLEYNTDARMFLVKPGMSHLEIAAKEARAETAFLDLLAQRTAAGRHVSDKPQSRHYAPKAFAVDQIAHDAKLKKEDLEAAMERLFAKGTVKVEPYGPPSDKTTYIVLV